MAVRVEQKHEFHAVVSQYSSPNGFPNFQHLQKTPTKTDPIVAVESLSTLSLGKRKIPLDETLSITIRIRSPRGKIVQERFSIDDTLESLFKFGAENGFENCLYKVISKVPNTDLSLLDKNTTFKQIDFSSQETIAVEFEEESEFEQINDQPCNSKSIAKEEKTVSVAPKFKINVNRTSSIAWYKRVDYAFDWEIITYTYCNRLETAYADYCSSDRRENSNLKEEIFFDDYGDYVLIDFNKMVVLPLHSDDVILYHLKRKNVLDHDIPFEWNWDGSSLAEYELVELDVNCPEYRTISNDVMLSGNFLIEKIERVENPIRYKQYLLLKEKLEILHNGQPNFVVERHLFHGTEERNISSICSNGFNRSLSGQHGVAYGRGSYFATNFMYSSRYGASKIFYASVLTGIFTQGHSQMQLAPDFDAPRGVKYDSVVDNPHNPTMFVVFSDNHAYPSYLITYSGGFGGGYSTVGPQRYLNPPAAAAGVNTMINQANLILNQPYSNPANTIARLNQMQQTMSVVQNLPITHHPKKPKKPLLPTSGSAATSASASSSAGTSNSIDDIINFVSQYPHASATSANPTPPVNIPSVLPFSARSFTGRASSSASASTAASSTSNIDDVINFVSQSTSTKPKQKIPLLPTPSRFSMGQATSSASASTASTSSIDNVVNFMSQTSNASALSTKRKGKKPLLPTPSSFITAQAWSSASVSAATAATSIDDIMNFVVDMNVSSADQKFRSRYSATLNGTSSADKTNNGGGGNGQVSSMSASNPAASFIDAHVPISNNSAGQMSNLNDSPSSTNGPSTIASGNGQGASSAVSAASSDDVDLITL